MSRDNCPVGARGIADYRGHDFRHSATKGTCMERNPDIGFASYDRFFPSQDNLPSGGFGNLIALPLQHAPRLAGNCIPPISNLLRPPMRWYGEHGFTQAVGEEIALYIHYRFRDNRIAYF